MILGGPITQTLGQNFSIPCYAEYNYEENNVFSVITWNDESFVRADRVDISHFTDSEPNLDLRFRLHLSLRFDYRFAS